MRKLVQALVAVCMLVLSAQVVFAASEKETIQEGADLSSVHRLAIALPEYYPTGEKPATKEEVVEAIAAASKVARCYVLSYDDAAYAIRSAGGPDIKVLDRRKAVSEFKAGIGKHADAYVVMTVANNSGIVCFFDVYRAGTNDLLYTYQVGASRFAKNTPDTFKSLSEQFFKKFESSAEDQQKREAREARKKK